jgi:hypothetical protein
VELFFLNERPEFIEFDLRDLQILHQDIINFLAMLSGTREPATNCFLFYMQKISCAPDTQSLHKEPAGINNLTFFTPNIVKHGVISI